jgi:hypothetical protein
MDTMATRSSEPVAMIPKLFLQDIHQKNPFVGCFYASFRRIILRPAHDHPPAFSGTMKILCPLTVCFLQNHGEGADSILFPYQSGINPSPAPHVLYS